MEGFSIKIFLLVFLGSCLLGALMMIADYFCDQAPENNPEDIDGDPSWAYDADGKINVKERQERRERTHQREERIHRSGLY